MQRFHHLLSSLRSLEIIQPYINLQEALRRLRSQTEETLFQAEGAEAPVQVMGVLEAAGLSFDHLWVVGLTDDQWPAAPSPNPLLPQGLQRKLNMPHASAERELAFSALMTERLLTSAPEVVVSHASRDQDRPLRPSPLIAGLPVQDAAGLGLGIGPDPYGPQAAELEQFTDDKGPALPAGSRVPGGTWIFADQAQCPFRAFAIHRLGANPIAEPVSGLDGRERGSLLHSVMEAVWSRLQDRATLLATPAEALESLVGGSVAQAIAALSRHKPITFAPRFTELERERLTRLVLQWLELEKERADFRVEELEQRTSITVGELQLDTRADRVDRLEDERLAIIDYKTGRNVSIKGWFEERLEEPQLPLYATAAGENIAAVLVAHLNREKSGFQGVASDDEIVPRIKAFREADPAPDYGDWDGLFQRWNGSLQMLAGEIQTGRAEVDPKDPGKSCRYCPLPSLCRIHERQEIPGRELE
jgi:probable DNA repair protein